MTVVRQVKLFFQEGTSDKVYHATLIDEGNGMYSVEVEWGRRTGPLNKGKKAVKVSRAAAERAYARLVREKTSKGYESMAVAAPQAVAPPEGQGSGRRATGLRKRVGHRAQLLNAVEEDEALRLLEDDRVIAQQKLDGNRVLLHVGTEVVATNRAGQATTLHASIAAGAARLPPGTVLDGEVVASAGGSTYWVFDVLSIGAEDVRTKGYLTRWARLGRELESVLSGPLRVLDCARNSKTKRVLYDRLLGAKAEGIVFKEKEAPYASGRPASGGTQLKHKFVKSADVLLTVNAGNAYQMAVYAGKKLKDVGKVFSGTTNQSRQEIDDRLSAGERLVAEVRYLYATDDEQLFQPVFVGLRTDKLPADCSIEQLQRTSRDVHQLSPRRPRT